MTTRTYPFSILKIQDIFEKDEKVFLFHEYSLIYTLLF